MEKSDAQLDAEAAAPLSELIRKHRVYYARDLYKPWLSSDDPPVMYNDDGEPEVQVTEIGRPLSWPLTSHVFSETRFIEEDGGRVEVPVHSIHGPDSMWSKAAFAQWATCRRVHPEHHERPEFHGSLCKQLIGLVIRQNYHLERACLKLGLTPERAARTLRSALLGIDAEMKRQHEKAQQRAHEDAGQFVGQDTRGRYVWDGPPPIHHAVPGLHEHDCPNPDCVQRRAA